MRRDVEENEASFVFLADTVSGTATTSWAEAIEIVRTASSLVVTNLTEDALQVAEAVTFDSGDDDYEAPTRFSVVAPLTTRTINVAGGKAVGVRTVALGSG